MDGLCFRFPAPSVAEHVAGQLRSMHPGERSPAPAAEDTLHVPESLWAARLTPEIVIGNLGRVTGCVHDAADTPGA